MGMMIDTRLHGCLCLQWPRTQACASTAEADVTLYRQQTWRVDGDIDCVLLGQPLMSNGFPVVTILLLIRG